MLSLPDLLWLRTVQTQLCSKQGLWCDPAFDKLPRMGGGQLAPHLPIRQFLELCCRSDHGGMYPTVLKGPGGS